MVDEETGAMAGEPRRPSATSDSDPGLVLVYAPVLDGVPSVIPLGHGSVVIGREPPPGGGGVTLPLQSVSRLHARVQRERERWTVHDLGSRNGVLVRGRTVESAELAAGDDVRIGDALFVFVTEGASLHAKSRIDGVGDPPYPHAPIACGPATRAIFDQLEPIAASNIPVLVLGETGTGKELVAQAVHAASRRSGALRALNCAAIPASLVESELFGFKKGAFTGADRDSIGIVRAADGGTLFLDEIGDLPIEIQPKLLRLLESNEVAPLGGARPERVDVRIVCATHADMDALVRTNRFRADLYSRIRGHVVRLPPLRERKEDLVRLVRALLARIGRDDAQVSVAFMMALGRHDWPFNVRELYGVLRRATALAAPGATLDVEHLAEDVLESGTGANPPLAGSGPPREVRRATAGAGAGVGVGVGVEADEPRPPMPTADELREALQANGGNLAALARIFRRDRSLIHRWLKQHGIDPGPYRAE